MSFIEEFFITIFILIMLGLVFLVGFLDATNCDIEYWHKQIVQRGYGHYEMKFDKSKEPYTAFEWGAK